MTHTCVLHVCLCVNVQFSIHVKSENIDVNVHPTKHEVHFLYEDKLIEKVQECVEKHLLSSDSSRTYYTQALLPTHWTGNHIPSSASTSSHKQDGGEGDIAMEMESRSSKPYEYNMVRTDASERTLKAFVMPKEILSTTVHHSTEKTSSSTETTRLPTQRKRKKQPVHLTSVLSLQKTVRSQSHSGQHKLLLMAAMHV